MSRGNPNPSPSTRFKPGVVTNPLGGRAKDPEKAEQKRILSGALKAKLRNDPELVEKLITILIGEAKKKKQWAFNMIFDRSEGKPFQEIDLNGSNPFSTLSDEELNQKIIELSKKIAQ